MKVRCIKVKLKSESINQVKGWFVELNRRKDEVLESMRQENITIESAFLDHQENQYYLIYYIKSPDIKKALEVFEHSLLPIDQFYKKNWNQFCETVSVLDPILDLELN